MKAAHRLFDFVTQKLSERKIYPLGPNDSFRASRLGELCPREEVLASRYEIIRVDHLRPDLMIVFDIGDLFHYLYRNIYFGPMGEWRGAWRCSGCSWDTDIAGLSSPPVPGGTCGLLAKMPSQCPECGAPVTFKEWLIEDKNIGLSGHPDGWDVLGSTRTVVDLKSQGFTTYRSRRSITPGHDVQIWAYEYLCSDKNGEVWYLNKSPWGDAPSFIRQVAAKMDKLEFKIRVIDPLREMKEGLNGGKLPEPVCENKICPRAVECQLADVCWES